MKRQKKSPPKWAVRFLEWYCKPELLEEIQGDIYELFDKRIQQLGPKMARRFFIWDVVRSFRLSTVKGLKFDFTNLLIQMTMFQNYIKVAWRNLIKQKLYSFINISGLSIGLACFILIFLYVQHEASYDRFFENSEQVYRVYQQQPGNVHMGSDLFAATPYALAKALMEEYPEVEQATSVREVDVLLGGAQQSYLESGFMADAYFFEVLPFPFKRGNVQTALQKPQSIVITETFAQKVFGDHDPLGQTILYQNETPYTITGVLKDLPTTSSLQFSFIVSILSNDRYLSEISRDKWYNSSCHTFFTLAEGSTPGQLEEKLADLLAQNAPSPENGAYFIQPLSDLYLNTSMNAEIGLKGNLQYIRMFSFIGLLVLLLACANYINLAIARSIRRIGEVGMRKVLGATRKQLIGQFIGEAILITFISLLLALLLIYWLSPVFSHLLERPIKLSISENIYLFPALLALVVIVGIFSGSYPAFLVSSFHPAQTVKGKLGRNFTGLTPQQWLMVGQYASSVALVIGSFMIYQQFQYIRSKELGYEKEQVLTLRVRDNELQQAYQAIKNQCLRNPQIISMAASWHLPTNITSSTTINDNDDQKENDLTIYETRVTEEYLNVFGIELLAGRFPSADHLTDFDQGYVLNEAAAKALGWTASEAIGKHFTHEGTETVVGVVKDFHMYSMHSAIQPLMLRLTNDGFSYFSLKIRSEQLPKTLSFLEDLFKQHTPFPFEYQFLDDQFDQLYKTDTQFGQLFGLLTLLSILIASVGLFGLAAYTAELRTKEIGIRKIVGASVGQVVAMISKDFLRIVLLGCLIGIPIAWYFMQHWLQNYAYRIELQWWYFAGGILTTLFIAWLTISFQTLKAAYVNPAESLKR